MIRFITKWAVVCIIALMLGVACSKTQTNQPVTTKNTGNETNATLNKASETLTEASKAIQKEMDQLQQEMRANLASIDAKFQEIQTKRDSMKDAKAKEELDARLTELKKQRDALQARIDQIESQDKDQTTWQKFKDDTVTAWHNLENSVKDEINKISGKS